MIHRRLSVACLRKIGGGSLIPLSLHTRHFFTGKLFERLFQPAETKTERIMRARASFKEAVKELQIAEYLLPEEEIQSLSRDPNSLTLEQIEVCI